LLAVFVFGSFATVGASGQASAKWTFAIYMCSDNDLDAYGELNNEWLMSVGSSDDVNIVVFWDRSDEPAYLYKILEGSMEELTDFDYNGVEVNMGDPDVLAAFVSYLDSEMEADRVLLTLWNHGDDFRGVCFDYTTGTDDSVDYLTQLEIGDRLAGKPIDVIAVDGCGLGCIETAYEYVSRGVTAEYFVASGNYVPLDGFPYDKIAADLVADPDMSPEMLSKDIVERYAEYYQKGWLTELAVVKLTALNDLLDELWDVTEILMDEMATYRWLVAEGRGEAIMGWSQHGWEATVDMATVFEVIYAGAPEGSELKAEAEELMDAFAEAIPYNGLGSPADVWHPWGLSVFFPPSAGSYRHNVWWHGSIYPTLAFAQDGWLDFLGAFWGKK